MADSKQTPAGGALPSPATASSSSSSLSSTPPCLAAPTTAATARHKRTQRASVSFGFVRSPPLPSSPPQLQSQLLLQQQQQQQQKTPQQRQDEEDDDRDEAQKQKEVPFRADAPPFHPQAHHLAAAAPAAAPAPQTQGVFSPEGTVFVMGAYDGAYLAARGTRYAPPPPAGPAFFANRHRSAPARTAPQHATQTSPLTAPAPQPAAAAAATASTTATPPDKSNRKRRKARIFSGGVAGASGGSPQQAPAPQKQPALKTELYKTELCHKFQETGSCWYGSKCHFAHGEAELRPVQRHPLYKTEYCRMYHMLGHCNYGTRCRFIHESPDEGQYHGGAARAAAPQRRSLNSLLAPAAPTTTLEDTPTGRRGVFARNTVCFDTSSSTGSFGNTGTHALAAHTAPVSPTATDALALTPPYSATQQQQQQPQQQQTDQLSLLFDDTPYPAVPARRSMHESTSVADRDRLFLELLRAPPPPQQQQTTQQLLGDLTDEEEDIVDKHVEEQLLLIDKLELD